jgi:GTPase
MPADGGDPVENYRTIRRELELYRPELAVKPEVLAMSKSELTGNEQVRQRLAKEVGRDVLAISAVTGAGLADLVREVVERLAEVRREDAAEPSTIVIPPHRRMQSPEAEEEVLA